MLEGLKIYAALLVGLAVCIIRPGLASAALLLLVGGAIVVYEITRPSEGAERSRERDH